ncbi:DegV family protein [Intestinibacillus massiliensis]|uniref:DegV family protein n=1 Tax=Intestinibacillus massiliensis TaxID=1871029 RepID=UPI000B35CFD6|nr:DegV family protein [Intestinibacillus massiliensis]MCB6365795.1 DegV family protein [Intestinibacillus massiliensis]
MEKIHIFTDSAADIPRPLCEQYGIEIVPIAITHNGRTFQEYYDITPQEYWKLLEGSDEIPTTAQTTPSQLMEVYRAARGRGCTHVLGVMINGKGSGCYQSACIARDLFYDEYGRGMEIELVDSETYTYIYGHVVVKAARMRAEGESFEAIRAVVHSRLKRCEAVLGVYSLKHLKKSGRISGGAAFVGEALGLRPISLVSAGAVTVMDKVRGDKNVIPKMVAHVKKNAVSPAQQTAGLLYGDVPEARIEELERLLLSECGFAAVERWPIGVSVITNTGPLALAAYYYGASRDGV